MSDGTETTCLSLTIGPDPTTFEIGPFCPRNIADGPDKSGKWIFQDKLVDADGPFIAALADNYGDETWQLFDPATGKINVTDTKLSCEAAARPDVAEEYQNHCVECEVSYLEEGTTMTYVIPLNPVKITNPADRVGRNGVGIGFAGVRIDAAAPIDAILGAHTLAAFDDCGGHVNPHAGYHIHAVNDCITSEAGEGDHAGKVGLALDGYTIFASLLADGTAPDDLDSCRGHATDGDGYHYHAGDTASNAILGCHSGAAGCLLDSKDATCDASATEERRGGPPGAGGGAGGGGPPPDGAGKSPE
ncbi:MAG: YHYH protein [Erythrobacter sp.]